jgi:nucleoside-diphosphate-sugar epimerase
MSVLVTGGTGFLGQSLVRLLAQTQDVVALHRPGSTPPAQDRVTWIAQDLAEPLVDELPESIDAVLHVAQSRRYREFPDGSVDVVAVNTMATTRLLDYCHRAGGKTFVFASTGAVSGAGPDPIHEDDTPAPGNMYAISKHAGERIVEQYRPLMTVHNLRYFFIYGPGQQAMMMPGIVGRVQAGQDVSLAGENGIAMNPVFVEDAARATAAALELTESSTINVAGPEVVTIRRIGELIGEHAGREPSFAVGDPAPDFIASIERMSQLLGAPTTTPGEGLAQMVAAR